MIKRIINNIAKDKKDHVLLGMFVGYPLMALGYAIDSIFSTNYAFISAAILGIIIVGLKEVFHDWYQGKGNPEWWDFIASAIPIIFSLITYLIK